MALPNVDCAVSSGRDVVEMTEQTKVRQSSNRYRGAERTSYPERARASCYR
jgi:hypothetical protein